MVKKEKKYFVNLQELRGMSACLIVLSHITLYENLIGTSWGGYGVMMFFLLSGFLVVHSTENNQKNFLFKRIIRIIPLYYCVTFFTYFLACIKPVWFNTTVANPNNLLKSLLFIPYANPNGFVRPILDVSWALFPEVWFYIVFFIAMKISHKYRAVITSCFFMIIYLVGIIVWNNNSIFNQYKLSMVSLVCGVSLYYVWKKIMKNYIGKINPIIVKLLLVSFFFISGLIFNFATISGYSITAFLLPILVFYSFLYFDGYLHKSKFFSWIGTISYSLYLTHEFVVKGVSRLLFPLDDINLINFAISLVCLGLSIVVAKLSYIVIEKQSVKICWFLYDRFICKVMKNK